MNCVPFLEEPINPMLARRTLTALVAALLLPLSMTAASLCDLSCSLQEAGADCEMAPAGAANSANQTARFASRAMDMPPGMKMGFSHQDGHEKRVSSASDQCPNCRHELCTQDSLLKSVVRGVDPVQVKNFQRAAVSTLDLVQFSAHSDWIQRESPPPKIEIAYLSANLRI